MPNGPQAALIVLAILVPLVGLSIYLIERRHGGRDRRRHEAPRLPLFGTDQLQMRRRGDFGDDAADVPAPARPPRRTDTAPRQTRPAPPPPASPPEQFEKPRDRPAPPAPVAPPPVPASQEVTRPMPAVRPTPAPPPFASNGRGMPSDLVPIDGETLRFILPADGTVEFLPGRLEVVAGPEAGREIRFARTPGERDIEVTFGRSDGPPNRHIQILARTVSRRHAVMSLLDEHWQLTNLSSTNPLVLNGRVLAGNEVAPLLVEGDRIEMGEVAFVFHDG